MSDYYESICKLYEKTMQRLEAEDYQGGDYRFLKGEAHAYFTAMQLSEFHSAADEPPAPVLTAEMATALDTLSTNDGLGFTLQIASQLTGRNLAYWRKGQDDVHVELTITKAGHAALKAHQASAEAPPRCACGNTNNLTEVIATPDGTYHLCPEHLAEEEQV